MQVVRLIFGACLSVCLLLHSQKVDAAPPLPYWDATRIINEVPKDRGTINERLHLYPARNYSNENDHYITFTDFKTPTAECPYTSKDAYDVVDAIEKLINFFYAKRAKETLLSKSDSGMGLLALNNQLEYIVTVQKQKLLPELNSFLSRLRDSSGDLANKFLDDALKVVTLPSMKKKLAMLKNNPSIFNGQSKWHGLDTIKKHFNEFQNIGNEKEVIYSFLDIQCLAEVGHDCSVPEVCKAMFLGKIYAQYMLSHQVMFQQIAQQRSCASANPEPFKDSREYQDRLCSKAYLEAEFLESHKFPTKFVSLFADHVVFCGMLGYPNFMRGDWLQEILSWRAGSASGCVTSNMYGHPKNNGDEPIQLSVERDGAKSDEECLINLTSLSLGALAMNLRYMVDACEPAIFERYFKTQD